MKRMIMLVAMSLSLVSLAGCEKAAQDSSQEGAADDGLPKIKPDLPAVPTIPPPPYPITYADESHSVFGIRHRMRYSIDTETAVTGYIISVYEPPVCKEKNKDLCPIEKAPHIWIGDKADEGERAHQLIVVGYADNQKQLDRAQKGQRDRSREPNAVKVPTDFAVGNKVKVKGHFTMLAAGFNTSNGLLEYLGHDTVEKAK